MDDRLCYRINSQRFHRCAGALLALTLVPLPARPQSETPAQPEKTQSQATPPAQRSAGIGFWDLPERILSPMLAAPPRKEADRYARLRQYFISFGCTGDNLSDLLLERNTHHPILVCTLPGTTTSRIVVTAGLPRYEYFQGASDGWPDAVMLPILYHALKAQPRHSTFVFAELAGDHGDMDFQKHLETSESSSPLALVSVSALGFGPPAFSNLAANDLVPAVRPNVDVLQNEAWRMLQLLRIDTTHQAVGGQFSAAPSVQRILVRDGPKDLPRILFYSNPVVLPGRSPAVSLATLHQNHDFLAFYLGDIDNKLTPPSR